MSLYVHTNAFFDDWLLRFRYKLGQMFDECKSDHPRGWRKENNQSCFPIVSQDKGKSTCSTHSSSVGHDMHRSASNSAPQLSHSAPQLCSGCLNFDVNFGGQSSQDLVVNTLPRILSHPQHYQKICNLM